MIVGAHTVIYSRKPDADREFFRDVLKLSSVDAGEGWLIFALPPAEVAVHPSRKNNVHEFYLLCANIKNFCAAMARRQVQCSPIQRMSWGSMTSVSLPGGGKLGVYEPRHARPSVSKPGRRRSVGRRLTIRSSRRRS